MGNVWEVAVWSLKRRPLTLSRQGSLESFRKIAGLLTIIILSIGVAEGSFFFFAISLTQIRSAKYSFVINTL